MKKALLILAFLGTSSLIVPANAGTAIMSMKTIQAMLSGGVPVATIVDSIKTAKQVDLYNNADEFKRLETAGASKTDADEIMKAINVRESAGFMTSSPVAVAATVQQVVAPVAPAPAPVAKVETLPLATVSPFPVAQVATVQPVPLAVPVAPVQPVPVQAATVAPVAAPVPQVQPVPVAPAALVPTPVAPVSALGMNTTIRPGSTLFIEPGNGFESYITAALVKKKVPVKVTTDKMQADYMLLSAVIQTEEKSGLGKLARCAFAYCIGCGFWGMAISVPK